MCKSDKKRHSNLLCLRSDRQKRCENIIFLKLCSVRIFIVLRVKNLIYFNNNDDYIKASSSPTSMLVRLECVVGILLCPKICLEFLQ